jgi:hypothetical protein
MFHVKHRASSTSAERRSASTVLRDDCDVSRETVPIVTPSPNIEIAEAPLRSCAELPRLKIGRRDDNVASSIKVSRETVGSCTAPVDRLVRTAAPDSMILQIKHDCCDQVDFCHWTLTMASQQSVSRNHSRRNTDTLTNLRNGLNVMFHVKH